MVAPVFTDEEDEELESLRRFPEIGREGLFRFFTLPPADSAFIDRGRGPTDRLGLAVAVCTFAVAGVRAGRGLGTVGSRGTAGRTAPGGPGGDPLLRASGEDPDDHLRLAAQHLGWRAPTTLELKELDEFLLARAMEHDSPTLLFRPDIHNIGLNSPLVSPGAAGLLKQVASPATTRER